MIAVIDNYDSFVYNLVQYLGELSAEVVVFRNDQITVAQLQRAAPQAIFLSPGPGTPRGAGICVKAVQQLAGAIPIFGVCLGHQAIAEAFGGLVRPAGQVVHGKTSQVYHDRRSIYTDLPNPFTATRYHSLIVEPRALPRCLEISAWTREGIIMGIRHRRHLVEGVQFHPESILTDSGKDLIRNFLRQANFLKRGRGIGLASGRRLMTRRAFQLNKPNQLSG